MSDENSAGKELEFYRRRVDELAGQAVRADSVVSRAKRELKQRRQGFALLTELHQVVTTDMPEETLFREVVDRLERHLKMDRSLILRREEGSAYFRPCYFHGFPPAGAERLPSVSLALPEPLAQGEAPLLVTNATVLDEVTAALKRDMETPFFVCAAISAGDRRDHVLLTGRMREAKPFFPPLDEGDVYTVQSIAGFLGAAMHNSALFAHTERMARSFARFVPSEFLQFLSRRSIVDVELGDQTQQVMTVLFSDIRSFTSRAERMTPSETFAFINRYLQRAAPVVRANGGFIDKFIGDGIMALFPGSPANAIRAALGLHDSVRHLNVELIEDGVQPIAIGVGLNTGLLMLGTIGFEERMESTVVSDAVNQAARAEGMTKMYAAPVIATGETIGALTDAERAEFTMRPLDRVQVVGKSDPLDAFELFDCEPEPRLSLKRATLKSYETSFERWLAGDFAAAHAGFSEVLERDPEDKAARIHLARCLRFLQKGAPPNWKGIVPLDSK